MTAMTFRLRLHPAPPSPEGLRDARHLVARMPGGRFVPDNWVDEPLYLVAFANEIEHKHEAVIMSGAWPVVEPAGRRCHVLLAPRLAAEAVAYTADYEDGPYAIPGEYQELFTAQRALMLDTIGALMGGRGHEEFGWIVETLIAMLDDCATARRHVDAGVLRAFVALCDGVEACALEQVGRAAALI